MIHHLRRRAYELLEQEQEPSVAARMLKRALAALIVVNIAGVVLGTMPQLRAYAGVFRAIERVSVGVFSIEY